MCVCTRRPCVQHPPCLHDTTAEQMARVHVTLRPCGLRLPLKLFFRFTSPLPRSVSSPSLFAPYSAADCSVTNKRTDARYSAAAVKTGSLPTTRLYRRLLFFSICFLCVRFPFPPVANLLCKIALSRLSSRRLRRRRVQVRYDASDKGARAHIPIDYADNKNTIQHGNKTVMC